MKPDSDQAPLSVCIIAFNEEDNIRDCLESVAWADEIVVVDSFSTDATPRICREYTDRVIQRPWPGYVAQKTFALEQASHEWVLCLDADERVTPELAEEIRGALRASRAGKSGCAGYTMPRRTFYLGRWMRHGGWYPDRKLRLLRRSVARVGGTEPHDHHYVEGKVGHLRGDLHHYTYRDLSDHLGKVDKFTTAASGELVKSGARWPLLRMIFHPPGRFVRMYLLRRGFLDGVPGLVAAVTGAFYVFLKYAKLWESLHCASARQLHRQADNPRLPARPTGGPEGKPRLPAGKPDLPARPAGGPAGKQGSREDEP
jgi:glycosyltransferase involved in cell wall biosynthesis